MTNSNSLALIGRSLQKEERMQFQVMVQAQEKKVSTGILLALFAGGFGAHKFWLGNNGAGFGYILLTIFTLGFGSGIASLIDICCMGKTVSKVNRQMAMEVKQEIELLR